MVESDSIGHFKNQRQSIQPDADGQTRIDVQAKAVVVGEYNKQINIFYGDDPEEEKLNRDLDETPPYKGLDRFTASDSSRFYGRSTLIKELIEYLKSHELIFLLGSSGSGKSSLVQAGLIPQFPKQSGNLINLCFVPNESPYFSFYSSVLSFISLNSQKYRQSDAQVASPPGEVDTLSETVKMLRQEKEDLCLIFIDQFEETFTLSQEEERSRFIRGLVNLITQAKDQESLVKIIFAMRTDFLDRLKDFPEFASAIQRHIYFMTEMTDRELKLAIKNPAAKHGVDVEVKLVEEIINDFRGSRRSLPLLQYTLDQLWREDDLSDKKLDYKTYEVIGRVGGALQQRAEAVYQKFEAKNQGEAVETIFVGLITITADGKTVSRRGSRARFSGGAFQEVIDQLIRERLIVSGRSEQPVSGWQKDTGGIADEAATIEIAHEALIDSWSRLQDWARKHEEVIILERQLVEAAQTWHKVREDETRSRSEFWQGSKLERVLELQRDGSLASSDPNVKPVVEAFIAESTKWSDLQLIKEQEQNAKLQRALTEATVREQATRVVNLLPTKPLEAMVLAIQTMGLNLEQMPESLLGSVQTGVQQAMENRRIPIQIFQGHKFFVSSVAFSPDGKTIVSGSQDKTIRLWNLQGNPIGQPFMGHESVVSSVAFSPDGKMIVSGSYDHTIRLWDLQGNAIGQPFMGHKLFVNSAAFSPDGKTIVSGSMDNTIRLWDLQGNAIGEPFVGHESIVNSVAFSPDGKTIISGSRDNTIRLWDLQGNAIGQPFVGHESDVNSVAFSPDGKTIISGSRDNTIRLWDLQGNAIGQPFVGHESDVNSVAFSPDGKTIVSGNGDFFSVVGGEDNTIRLWDLQGNSVSQPFLGHKHSVSSVAFSPDSKTIVSGSWDNTIRLWDLQGNAIGQPFVGHEHSVHSVAFSPNGKTIVSGSEDGTIRLWDLQGNAIGQPFMGHESVVSSVAFSPDGKMIVSGSYNTIQLWNLQGNEIMQPLIRCESIVSSVAFSPDSKTIVSGSMDNTIRLWNLQGNAIGQPFVGHEHSVTSVTFSPDGKTIVSGSEDGTIRLWDLQGNAIGQSFVGHESDVTSVAFSPDGKTIVSGSGDETIRLWDLQGNAIGEPFVGHESIVNSVAFSPDSKTIISGSLDRTIRLWQGNWQAWLEVCCERLRFHPVFQHPAQVFRDAEMIRVAEAACETCRKYVWETQAEPAPSPTTEQPTEAEAALSADAIKAYFNQGVALIKAKQYGDAIQNFDQVIGAHPNSPIAYYYRGYCHAQSSNKPAAIHDLQQAAQRYQAQGKTAELEQVSKLLQQLQG